VRRTTRRTDSRTGRAEDPDYQRAGHAYSLIHSLSSTADKRSRQPVMTTFTSFR
jgi:hypothetical protein